jgi:glutathione S-transferase
MDTMTLYYLPGSASLAVHIVIRWLGLPYRMARANRGAPESRPLLGLNPVCVVPVLEHRGLVLTQTAAILQYLASLDPSSQLLDETDIGSKTETQRWLAFISSDVHPAFRPMYGGTAYLEVPELIERSRQAARDALRPMFAQADRRLEAQPWLAGARSIADPYLYVMLRTARANIVDLSGFGQLQRFMVRFEDDPDVREALTLEGLT